MEEQRNISAFLNEIPQPAILVWENQITTVNQAAGSMLLASGQDFSSLLCGNREDYEAFQEGQISLTLSVAGHRHHAVVTRTAQGDLVVLNTDSDLGEFRSMALVAMEMRMPLMQAIASARQMDADVPASASINQSLMQMLRMVSNMADISRYTLSSRMELREVDSFLMELFEKATALASKNISIRFEGLRQPVFSLIDPEQVERAVWNILSNCIKFTPAGGSITAKLTRTETALRLTVTDSGSGIAHAVRSDLFHRYLRQPGIEDSRYGLGLGLAIVRTVAANHGGTVLVRGTEAGGTAITMTLALRQDSAATLHSPLLRPDYTGGWDHALVELSDCLSPDLYQEL